MMNVGSKEQKVDQQTEEIDVGSPLSCSLNMMKASPPTPSPLLRGVFSLPIPPSQPSAVITVALHIKGGSNSRQCAMEADLSRLSRATQLCLASSF